MAEEPNEQSSPKPLKDQIFDLGKNKYLIAIGAFITFLAGLAEISGYNLSSFITNGNIKDSSSLTINVHGQKGFNDLILTRKGKVEISYGNKKEAEDINDKGQAVFNEIPAWVFEEDSKVQINIRNTDGEPYRSSNPDSLYNIQKGEPIYLEVELLGLEKVFGSIIYNDAPLEGVVVAINELKDTSDILGNYNISIPFEKMRKKQEVKFFKPGFKMELKHAYPQTQAPLNVIMKKK